MTLTSSIPNLPVRISATKVAEEASSSAAGSRGESSSSPRPRPPPVNPLLLKTRQMSGSMTQSSSSSSSLPILDDNKPTPTRSILKIKTQEVSLETNIKILLPYQRTPYHRRTKRVRYSLLEIRRYPLCLGDHPAVRGGLPLALDYSQPPQRDIVSLEEYERQQRKLFFQLQASSSSSSSSSSCCRPRRNDELRLSQETRRRLLLGEEESCTSSSTSTNATTDAVPRTNDTTTTTITPSQIKLCLQEIRQIQQQRGWTTRTKSWEPIQEGFEHALALVSNATWNRRRKRKERELLRSYKTPQESPSRRRYRRKGPAALVA